MRSPKALPCTAERTQSMHAVFGRRLESERNSRVTHLIAPSDDFYHFLEARSLSHTRARAHTHAHCGMHTVTHATHARARTRTRHTHTLTCTHAHCGTHTVLYTCTRTHSHARTRTRTQTHTHTRTHTHARTAMLRPIDCYSVTRRGGTKALEACAVRVLSTRD